MQKYLQALPKIVPNFALIHCTSWIFLSPLNIQYMLLFLYNLCLFSFYTEKESDQMLLTGEEWGCNYYLNRYAVLNFPEPAVLMFKPFSTEQNC